MYIFFWGEGCFSRVFLFFIFFIFYFWWFFWGEGGGLTGFDKTKSFSDINKQNVRTSLLTEFHHNLNDSVECGHWTELRNLFGLTRRLSGNIALMAVCYDSGSKGRKFKPQPNCVEKYNTVVSARFSLFFSFAICNLLEDRLHH